MTEIDELEKKWNCKIDFPSTEMASDVVTISGPEYQVPQALDEFLVGFSIFTHADPTYSNMFLGNGPRKPRNCVTRYPPTSRIFQIRGF